MLAIESQDAYKVGLTILPNMTEATDQMAKKAPPLRELIHITSISRRRKTESEQGLSPIESYPKWPTVRCSRASLSPAAQAWYRAEVEAINPLAVLCGVLFEVVLLGGESVLRNRDVDT